MGKVAIVARVSTLDKQDYQRQINDLTSVILSHGYKQEDIEVFADKISGYSKNEDRQEFSRLLKSVTDFDCLYVTEISRLGRNPGDVRRTIDDIDKLKVPIYIQSLESKTIDGTGKRNAVIQIVIQVLIEFANAESEMMKIRSKSGLLASAKLGRVGGGATLPYGYIKGENKMMVINEVEAEVIKRIFELYSKGNGIRVIKNLLNADKTPTRTDIIGKKKSQGWKDAVVLKIIDNTLYKGERNFKGEILLAPAIVSSQLFDFCQDIKNGKTHRNYETSYTYLLKDIITCGCCGKKYFGKFKPTPSGDKVYICTGRLANGVNCGNVGINISLLESAIYDQFMNSDLILNYLTSLNQVKENLKDEIELLNNQVKSNKEKLKKTTGEKDKLLKAYLADVLNLEEFGRENKIFETVIENTIQSINQLEAKIKDKEKLLAKQDEQITTKKMLSDAKENRNELQSIFKQIIHKVIINNLNNDWLLATVFIQVNGIVLKVPLKIVLDKSGIRKKPAKFNYLSFFKMVSDPVFKDNVLLVKKNHIIGEIESELIDKDWISIPSENTLTIPIDKIAKKDLYLENIN